MSNKINHSNMKFSVGDKVKVVDDYTPHFRHIGEIVELNEHPKSKHNYIDYKYHCETCGKTRNFRSPSLELINK